MFARKLHSYIAIIILLPALLLIGTGFILAIKTKIPDFQPKNRYSPRGSINTASQLIDLQKLIQIARRSGHSHLDSWSDVKTIDIRPNLAVARVRTFDKWEYQIDLHTGEVLSSAPRYTSFVISIHEGSFFGDFYKWGVTIPVGVGLFLLSLTGAYIYFRSQTRKRMVRHKPEND